MKHDHTARNHYRNSVTPAAVAAILALVIATLATGNAHAGDRKTFHGSECKPIRPNSNQAVSYSTMGIYNGSTTNAYVICPIVRDNTLNTSGINYATLDVYQSPSTSSKLSCTLYSKKTWGATTVDSYYRRVSNSVNYRTLLTFYLDDSSKFGSYVFYCKIPPYSRISQIYFVEH